MRLPVSMIDGGGGIPADLEIDLGNAAVSAASTSVNSYTKTIRMVPVVGKTYKFFFTYLYEDSDTKKLIESNRSPAYLATYTIENLTKPVTNLTLTQGYKNYGVKFDIDPTSVHEDIVIFESLTSTSIGNIVYMGTSTNVTIPTNSIATRWITVRTRDKWLDANFSDTGPLPVTPLNPDPDTSTPPSSPQSASVVGSIDSNDKSGFSGKITASWTANTDTNTSGYVIRWTTQNPSVITNPLWEYGQVDGKSTTTFEITGLAPNTLYYWQVTAKSPYNAITWSGAKSGTVGPIVDPDAPAGNLQLKSILSIGGKTADLFKIGTGITQSINTSTTITPTQTSGTYNGIILDKSTTNFGHNYWLNTGQFRVGSSSSFLYWDGSDLYTTGKINATGGSFTGDVKLNGGTLYAGSLPNTGQRVRLNSSGIFAYSAQSTGSDFQTFSLDTSGYMNATSGLIGGWNLGTTTLSANNVILNSAGQISLGGTPSTSVFLSSSDTARIWVGSNSSSTAKFKVMADGTLYATGAKLNSLDVSSSFDDGVTLGTVKAQAASALSSTGTFSGALSGASITGYGSIASLIDSVNSKTTAGAVDNKIATAFSTQSNYSAAAIIGKINETLGITNVAKIDGSLLVSGTVGADYIVASYIYGKEIYQGYHPSYGINFTGGGVSMQQDVFPAVSGNQPGLLFYGENHLEAGIIGSWSGNNMTYATSYLGNYIDLFPVGNGLNIKNSDTQITVDGAMYLSANTISINKITRGRPVQTWTSDTGRNYTITHNQGLGATIVATAEHSLNDLVCTIRSKTATTAVVAVFHRAGLAVSGDVWVNWVAFGTTN